MDPFLFKHLPKKKLSDQERPDSNYAKESSVRLDNCTLNDMMLGFNIC